MLFWHKSFVGDVMSQNFKVNVSLGFILSCKARGHFAYDLHSLRISSHVVKMGDCPRLKDF